MELMVLRTTAKNKPPIDTSGLFVSLYTELAFIVENSYVEKLNSFLAENKGKIDLNYRFDDDCTVVMRAVLGAQKIDLQKDSALSSIKKCEQCLKILADNGFPLNAQDKYGHTAMHWAVMIQNPYILRWLLKLGADSTVQDEDGQTILHLAIRIGFADGITVIVENSPRELLELPSRISGATPLIYATQLGNRDLVKQLLDAGCNPNSQEGNKYQRAALHYAFFFDHDEIFEQLLLRGADINVTDYKKKGMLQRAAAHTDGRYLQSIVDNSQRSTSDYEQSETLRKVLTQRGVNGMTPLMAGAGAESGDNVELLCRMVKDQAFELDDAHRCALHYCSKNRELRCVQTIFQVAPDMLETRDENGVTPLMQAVLDGNVDVARFLLQQGANILTKDRELHTVAHSATVSGSPEIVDLMSYYNADLSQPDIYHTYPLHYAVRLSTEAGTVEQRRDAHKIINKLIAKGVPVNCEDDEKRQPLFWAASAGDERTCTILNNAGTDVNAANKDGLTALHCAASKGYAKLVEMLLTESNAIVDIEDKWGCTPLFYAITNQHLSCAEVLIKHGAKVNHQDAKGRTPAHCACAAAFFDGVDLLKKNDADFSIQNNRSELPIHESTRKGHREMVAYLLEGRLSEPNSKLKNGKTPLHQAVEQHDRDLIERLLAQGANVNSVMYEPPVKPPILIQAPRSSASSAASSRRDLKAAANSSTAQAKAQSKSGQKAAAQEPVEPQSAIPAQQQVMKLEEVGRTPLDIAIREGYKTIIELLKQNGAAKALRVITWNVRVIQRYFRRYQEYKEMLRQEEAARIAAEAEMRQLELERLERETEERRRQEQEYNAEMERRRAERALYEFSLSNVRSAPDDREEQIMSGVDGRIEMKVYEYERKLALQLQKAQDARKREIDQLVQRTDNNRIKRKASFEGDKPPVSLPVAVRSSNTAGTKQARVEPPAANNAAAGAAASGQKADNNGPAARMQTNLALQNPPPGWFVKQNTKTDLAADKSNVKQPEKTGRAKQIRESVSRFDQVRRATRALQAIKRVQLSNVAEDTVLNRISKEFRSTEAKPKDRNQANDAQAADGKQLGKESVSRSYSSGVGSTSYSEYTSTYDDRTTTRSGYTRSDYTRSGYGRASVRPASGRQAAEPKSAAVGRANQVPKQPKEVQSLKEWENYLKDKLRQVSKPAKPAPAAIPSKTQPTMLQREPSQVTKPIQPPPNPHEETLKQKRTLRKELKSLVIDTKLLINDTHDDVDDFLEKVGQRNKEEETNIKKLLRKKREEDMALARLQDDTKRGPRAVVDTNAPMGGRTSRLLDKRATGPPKSVLKRTERRSDDKMPSRRSSTIPQIKVAASVVASQADDMEKSKISVGRSQSADSNESSVELEEEMQPKDANDKNWIKTFDGRFRKRRPLVLTLPISYLKMQGPYTDEDSPRNAAVLAN